MFKKILAMFFLISFMICACSTILPEQYNNPNLQIYTSTPSSSPSDTPPPSPTFTIAPTSTTAPKSTPTLPLPETIKNIPTSTLARSAEWDIDPFFEKRIDLEWNDVHIKASFFVDKSFEKIIKSVSLPDHFLADFIQRSLFIVWYSRLHQLSLRTQQSIEDYNAELTDFGLREKEFATFLELWSKAQQSGEESDWRRVELRNVKANDLADGEDYAQKNYTFWPMYEGPTPEGVTAMNRFSIVITEPSATTNIARVSSYNKRIAKYLEVRGESYGFNFDNGDMMYYFAHTLDVNRCFYTPLFYCLRDFIRNHVFYSMGSHIAANTGDSMMYYDVMWDKKYMDDMLKLINIIFIIE